MLMKSVVPLFLLTLLPASLSNAGEPGGEGQCPVSTKDRVQLAARYLSVNTPFVYWCGTPCEQSETAAPAAKVVKTVGLEGSGENWSVRVNGKKRALGDLFAKVEDGSFRRVSSLVGCRTEHEVDGPVVLKDELLKTKKLGNPCDPNQKWLARMDKDGKPYQLPSAFVLISTLESVEVYAGEGTNWASIDDAFFFDASLQVLGEVPDATRSKRKTVRTTPVGQLDVGLCEANEKQTCFSKTVLNEPDAQSKVQRFSRRTVSVPTARATECKAMAQQIIDSYRPHE